MALQEKIYLNRDNAIKLGLTADGLPINAATLTKVIAKLTNEAGTVITFDSTTDVNAFDYSTETAQVSDTVTGILVIKLQDAVAPPAAGTDYTMDLILYDTANVNGIHWDSPFPVQVISG
jgi:hypothetical protein